MYPRKKINKPLGELLIERGVITASQLEEALNVQKQKGGLIGEIIVELGFAEEKDIAYSLSIQYGFPYIPLDNYEINSDVINIIPRQVVEQYCLMPLDKIGSTLMIAMADPLNFHAVEDIEYLTNCVVQIFISTISDIKKAIEKYYGK